MSDTSIQSPVSLAEQTYTAPTDAQFRDAVQLVNRFAERWAQPTVEGLRDLMHADTRNLIPPMTEPADRDGVLVHFRQVLAQLPDLRVEVIRWAPTGDCVMIEWAATAHIAGKPLRWTGVDRFGIRGERMYEAHVYWDTRRVAEQMAHLVQQAQAEAGTAK